MKKTQFKKELSVFLSILMVFFSLLSSGSLNPVKAATGTDTDPYSIAEAIAAAQNISNNTSDIQVSVQGYIVGIYNSPTPKGLILADAASTSSTAAETIYVVAGASDTQNKTEIANWNTPDKIGKKVKVTGKWRKAVKALYGGTSGRSCIGTVNGSNLSIVEAGSAPIDPVALISLSLDKQTLDLEVGKKGKLQLTYNPSNTTETSIDWKSSEDKIASVDQTGTITAVAPGGPVEITATSKTNPSIKVSCMVTVKEAAPIELSTIAEARAKALNKAVKVKGIVSRISGSNIFIQDATSGICVYKQGLAVKPGDELEVTGALLDYSGLAEIGDLNNATDTIVTTAKVLSSGNIITPKTVTLKDISTAGENLESQLVKIEKATLGKIDTAASTPLTQNGTTINIRKIPTLTGIVEKDLVDVLAIVGQFNKDYQLTVASSADITKADLGPDTVAPTINHTPVTLGNTGIDLEIKANITDDRQISTAKVYYRTKGDTEYKALDLVKTPEAYSIKIAKSELDSKGLQYYIEVSDGTNVVTSPTDKNSPYEVTISKEDVTAPIITKVTPDENSSTGSNAKPEISAEYNDATGINTATVKLYVDNVDVTEKANITDKKISFTSETALNNGTHQVKLVLSDSSPKGNSVEKQWSFSVGEEEYKTLFGMIHSHTAEGSDGIGTYDQAYNYARNTAKLDFFSLTDHSNWFDNDTTSSLFKNSDYTKDATENDCATSTKWVNMHNTADRYNEANKFTALAAFEMTWSGSTGGWGHMNTFNTKGFETRNHSAVDLKKYYDMLSNLPNSISQLNHPGKTFGDFDDFNFRTEAADKVVNMVEVGNGEGAVRSPGYFPSYDYYTRALDKGWHVAPTNNQDNHKGAWGDANTARTVALAKENTREGIYDAMRNRRMYATEDNNLKIDYRVNHNEMGSIIETPEKLDINISIEDPDSTDKVQKVSIISDGGAVIQSKNFDSNNVKWDLQLAPEHKYYYVRIDEADKDIAVTAPVWIGETDPVGISKVSNSQDTTIVNSPVDFTAEVFNNGTVELQGVKVEFYKNAVTEENKIGEQSLAPIAASSKQLAKITWTPNAKGDYKIYAVTKLNVKGIDKTFMESTTVKVFNKEDILKVVIDGGHQNQYVTGSYANKISKLTEMLNGKQCMTVINKDELTAQDLEDTRLLIITDPQSVDDTKNNLTKSLYTDAEVKVIKDFVAKGGNLIVTSKADYKDAPGEYSNGTQVNKILEAIDTNLRVNDDQVTDNTTNAGQAFRLAFDKFTSTKYNLTKDIPDGEKYSFYSGCSVITKPNANLDKVDYLVLGHDTTEALDQDGAKDNTPVEKGKVCALAAEQLQNGAKVIVGGSTFFSDFETTGDNTNANVPITKNILDWVTQEKPAELKTIAQVRVDANKDGIPDNLGKKFAIEGVVTAQSEAVLPKNAFFEVIYVQDGTAGITVFGVSKTPLPLGTKVRITGLVDQYQGDAELQIADETKDLQIIDSNLTQVEAKLMSTGDSMKEENEGWLTKVQGKVTKMDAQNLYINDGTGEARIYVEGYIGDATGQEALKGKWDANIKVGDLVSAIGLASEDPQGHRLRVRNTKEITMGRKNPINIKVNAPSEFKAGQDAKVILNAENLKEITQEVTLIVALYDSNNRFISYVAVTQDIKALDKAEMSAMLKIPTQIENYKVKCFVWDSIESMNALSQIVEIPVK